MSIPGTLPSDAFDCIILTQTLHLIYDFRTAVAHLYASLRPGGTLLLTVPGISQIDRHEWNDCWFWSFTCASLNRILSEVFDRNAFEVESHGNVFAAIAFLHGVACEEIRPAKLLPNDPAYPVILTALARKPVDGAKETFRQDG